MVRAVRDLYEQATGAFREGDNESMAQCFAADATWAVLEAAPDARVLHGIEQILQHFRDWHDDFESLDVDVHSFTEEGNRIVAEITLVGRGRASGAEARVDFVQIMWVRDGRFVRVKELPDLQSAREWLEQSESMG